VTSVPVDLEIVVAIADKTAVRNEDELVEQSRNRYGCCSQQWWVVHL
jgi:pantothenate synthetase